MGWRADFLLAKYIFQHMLFVYCLFTKFLFSFFSFQLFKSKVLELGEKLLPAFNTPTGIPRGVINLGRWVSAAAFTSKSPPSLIKDRYQVITLAGINQHTCSLFILATRGRAWFKNVSRVWSETCWQIGKWANIVFNLPLNPPLIHMQQHWVSTFSCCKALGRLGT